MLCVACPNTQSSSRTEHIAVWEHIATPKLCQAHNMLLRNARSIIQHTLAANACIYCSIPVANDREPDSTTHPELHRRSWPVAAVSVPVLAVVNQHCLYIH